jgi:hypothetical protein
MAGGGGGVRVRAIISHRALKMAAYPSHEVTALIERMDRKANDGMECVWTRAYCPTENETVICREYEYRNGCK